MSKARDLSELEVLLDYHFQDRRLLEEALTHPSVSGVREIYKNDYDRLEFLGDRVVGLLVATTLFQRHPEAQAGDLALRYNAIVRKESLARIAALIDIGPFLRLAKSEKQSGGVEKPAVLSDAMEAILGAIYLDGGLAAAEKVVEKYFLTSFDAATDTAKDPKTALQEFTHAQSLGTPTYQVISQTGPAHDPKFTIIAQLQNGQKIEGEGRSKREAEQIAARRLLDILKGTV